MTGQCKLKECFHLVALFFVASLYRKLDMCATKHVVFLLLVFPLRCVTLSFPYTLKGRFVRKLLNSLFHLKAV